MLWDHQSTENKIKKFEWNCSLCWNSGSESKAIVQYGQPLIRQANNRGAKTFVILYIRSNFLSVTMWCMQAVHWGLDWIGLDLLGRRFTAGIARESLLTYFHRGPSFSWWCVVIERTLWQWIIMTFFLLYGVVMGTVWPGTPYSSSNDHTGSFTCQGMTLQVHETDI